MQRSSHVLLRILEKNSSEGENCRMSVAAEITTSKRKIASVTGKENARVTRTARMGVAASEKAMLNSNFSVAERLRMPNALLAKPNRYPDGRRNSVNARVASVVCTKSETVKFYI